MQRDAVRSETRDLELIDGAADTLAALEVTTTMALDPDAPAPAGAGVKIAWAAGLVAVAVAFGSAVVAALVSVGVISGSSPSVAARVALDALAAALFVMAVVVAARAAVSRDAYAAAAGTGFGIAAGLWFLAEMQHDLIGAGGDGQGVVPLAAGMVIAAIGLAIVRFPGSGRVLGYLVYRSWLPPLVIGAVLAVAFLAAYFDTTLPGAVVDVFARACAVVALLLSGWAATVALQRAKGEPGVALVVEFTGIAVFLCAALSLLVGPTRGLGHRIAPLLALCGGVIVVVILLVEYARGRRTQAAIEGLFDWAPGDKVADHLAEAAQAVADSLGGEHVHSSRVIDYTIGTGRELDLPPGRLRVLGLGAMFHDVGTESIPDDVLNKPGTLTASERNLVEAHSERGYAMASRVQLLWEAAVAIRHHHEWVDGSGYPDGLEGSEIPIEARVIAVTDMYDALTTPRPYRDALSPAEALAMMRAEAGTHLDPRVFDAFVRYLAEAGVETVFQGL